jgi:dipeptidyl aminopeptidase/acylaminoacyl peptidase
MKNIFKKAPASVSLLLGFTMLVSCESDTGPSFLTPKELLDESYGSDLKQTMDVYLPAGRSSERTPLLVYIHGGAWMDGDKSEFLQIKQTLEQEFPDFALATLNYRLFDYFSQNNGIAEQEKDISAAFSHIQRKLASWDISDDLVIVGASAGGHLALLHAFKNNTSDLKAVAALFPPTDLTQLYQFNNITALALTGLVGGTPQTAPSSYRDLSPINFVGPQSVPTILFHGDLDTVVPITQSELLQQALQSNNVRHEYIPIPGQGHGFTAETYVELIGRVKDFLGDI